MFAGAGVMVAALAAAILVAQGGGGPAALAIPLAVLGFGEGMVAPPLIASVLARVPADDAGAASGVLLTATQIGNALGVAIVGGTFTAASSLGTRDAFTISAVVALTLAALTGVAAGTLRWGNRRRRDCGAGLATTTNRNDGNMTSTEIDLNDKTILVTGATDGLGRALARELAAAGATVVIHGRDRERIRQAEHELRQLSSSEQIRSYHADFASLADVRRMTEQILTHEPRLDVLVNNAGIGATVPGGDQRMQSADGYELRFTVNYLAGYLLTRQLLGLLKSSAPARIINVSSAGQMAIDFADVMLERDYSGVRAYCQSKLAQILFTFTLADELDGTGVTATCLHPATYMPTKIVASPVSTLEEGVGATLRLAVAPELAGVTGKYFNGTRESQADPQAYDPQARRRLTQSSTALVASQSRPG